MFKKEKGRYARFVAASLCSHRYQCRIGVLAAGDYGCPQVRSWIACIFGIMAVAVS